MSKRCVVVVAACAVVFLSALPAGNIAHSQEPKREEPLVNQVRDSIRRGIQYLRAKEGGRGNWEVDTIAIPNSGGAPGGETALVMLALLNAGVKPDDPMIRNGLAYLRKVDPKHTYVVGLQTMVFAAAGNTDDRFLIQRNVNWLINTMVKDGDELLGWGYDDRKGSADASNTQYALLGLHDGSQALKGANIDKKSWRMIRDMYLSSQNGDGGWGYHKGQRSTLTMTVAGMCGLYIAGTELNEGREIIQRDGTAKNCGDYKENEALTKAYRWLERDRLNLRPQHGLFYNIYGIERLGRLSGQRFLVNHDWYREGCAILVDLQNKDEGSWSRASLHDSWPVISTSFALLFLSKGRTPVLISKFAHGPGDDWNNDHHDARNLVDYSSKEMFRRTPLAWQIFDTTQTRIEKEADLLDATSDLLQSPILYINGHRAPTFTENQKRLLKEYVNNGGFILAEACCGRKEFTIGFRELIKELFDNELEPLADEHPIWSAWAPIKPDSCPYKLEGLQQGCKTVAILSPQDLSCLWEANQRETPQGSMAFRLGANIIAYATGMDLPPARLTQVEVFRTEKDPKSVPRGFLKAAQLRHGGDWQPAPKAMRNLMQQLREKAGLDVALQTEPILLRNVKLPSFMKFKFLYLHGRKEFSFGDADLEKLRTNLEANGILLADACCGSPAFDRSFRAFVKGLFPAKALERIPLTDELFSKEVNGGKAITSVRCRREGEKEYKDVPPYLEGIKVDGRWVVIYSKYDLGCALEKHQSSDCQGHDYESAVKIGSAVVLYWLKR
jgi:hypothetical protein